MLMSRPFPTQPQLEFFDGFLDQANLLPLSSGALELLENLKGAVLAQSADAKAYYYLDTSKPIFANPKRVSPMCRFSTAGTRREFGLDCQT